MDRSVKKFVPYQFKCRETGSLYFSESSYSTRVQYRSKGAPNRPLLHNRPKRIKPLPDIVKATLGLDTVMLSFSTADEDIHAPNEFFRLSAIEDGMATWVVLLRQLGTQDPTSYRPFISKADTSV